MCQDCETLTTLKLESLLRVVYATTLGGEVTSPPGQRAGLLTAHRKEVDFPAPLLLSCSTNQLHTQCCLSWAYHIALERLANKRN